MVDINNIFILLNIEKTKGELLLLYIQMNFTLLLVRTDSNERRIQRSTAITISRAYPVRVLMLTMMMLMMMTHMSPIRNTLSHSKRLRDLRYVTAFHISSRTSNNKYCKSYTMLQYHSSYQHQRQQYQSFTSTTSTTFATTIHEESIDDTVLNVKQQPTQAQQIVSDKIPIILLSGFLGAGKTCTLQHLLLQNTNNNTTPMQLGILVNDVASINIDAKYINNNNNVIDPDTDQPIEGSLSSTSTIPINQNSNKYDIIELQNGCACCSLQDDFLLSIERLIQNRLVKYNHNNAVEDETRTSNKIFDAIIVELSGVADPAAIQSNWKAIMMNTNQDESLFPDITTYCQEELQIVTLIDACTFGTDYMTWDVIGERPIWVTTDNVDECNERRKVSELLVEQVEAANIIVINKIDIATTEQITVTNLVVKALNEKAEIIPVQFGQVLPQQLLRQQHTSNDIDTETTQSECTNPTCTDPTHSHSHSHAEHQHDTKPENSKESDCHDPTCTDPTHSHSHAHAHSHSHSDHQHDTESDCHDPTCTDPTHNHNHDNNNNTEENKRNINTSTDAMGFVNFVYKANRPFHIERIMATLSQWPVPIKDTLDLGTIQQNDNAPYEINGQMIIPDSNNKSPFLGVLRSKGFCWFAPYKWSDGTNQDVWRHDTAMYWSHAGRQFGISKAGKWWATLSKERMKQYFNNNIQEYDRIMKEDYVTDEFGDRRQEIVFIGTKLNIEHITNTLNECLLNDKEMDYYRLKLRNYIDTTFTTAINNSGTTQNNGLFNVDTINHMDL